MTTHAIAMLRITDQDSLALYREQAGAALARHGGEVVQVSSEPKILEGAPVLPDIMALLRFPDRASAEAWRADPELADVHALRAGSGTSEILLF